MLEPVKSVWEKLDIPEYPSKAQRQSLHRMKYPDQLIISITKDEAGQLIRIGMAAWERRHG